MTDMCWDTLPVQRQAQERHVEIHLQGLLEDLLHNEEHDIQRDAQGHVSMDEIYGVLGGGLSLTESTERCGISYGTSFIWRYKILDYDRGKIQGDGPDRHCGGMRHTSSSRTRTTGRCSRIKSWSAIPLKRYRESHTCGLLEEFVCVMFTIDRGGAWARWPS